jgi:hypothetical protein
VKLFITILMAVFVSGAAQFVYAADEFGERFGEGAPAALRESSSEEINVQDIEPAAGEEAGSENNLEPSAGTEILSEPGIEPATGESGGQEPAAEAVSEPVDEPESDKVPQE